MVRRRRSTLGAAKRLSATAALFLRNVPAQQKYMKSPPAGPIGISLLFAAVLLVAVAALLALSSPGVGADPCISGSVPPDIHVDDASVDCSDMAHDDESRHYRILVDPTTGSTGKRGDTFQLRGRGLPEGTVTIFEGHVDGGIVLDRQDVGSSGFLTSAVLTARGIPGSGNYRVTAVDSEGVRTGVHYIISEPTASFEPATAIIGEKLTINIADWARGEEGVAIVLIGGVEAHIAESKTYSSANCSEYIGIFDVDANTKLISFEVTVPESVLTGEQTVSVYHKGQLVPPTPTECAATPDENPSSVSEVRPVDNAIPVLRETIRVITPEEAESAAPVVTQTTQEVDGGRDRELVFEANVPEDARFYDGANDSIVIRLDRSFDVPGGNMPGVINLTMGSIKVDDSGDDTEVPISDVSVDGTRLTLGDDLSGILDPGEQVTITIEKGTGIHTPETPRGFDNYEDEEPYEVELIFVDGDDPSPSGQIQAEDRNLVVVNNPLSSTVPGATVRVVLATRAEADIKTTDEIVVDFSGPSAESGFNVPSSIATSRIQVRHSRGTFNPAEVQVQGERVIFSVPSGTGDQPITVSGDYSITFSNLARIRNPFSAGIKTIRVSSFVPGDIEDIIEAVVRRTTTIAPNEGARGSEFMLEGKGYAPGTVTIFEGDDNIIDPGETLASVETVRGAFDVDLVARGDPGEASYQVRTRDSEGVVVSAQFNIKSSMSFVPATAQLGATLTITISDWEEERNEVVAAQIAGVEVFIADAIQYENCIDHPNSARRDSRGRVVLTVDLAPGVPRGEQSGIPPGEQTVAVFDYNQLDYFDEAGDPIIDPLPCSDLAGHDWGQRLGPLTQVIITDDPIAVTKSTVEVAGRTLTLTPSSAARGQRVTITGTGFTRAYARGGHIDSVWIGGRRVVDDHSGFEVGSNGVIAFAVTVPLDIADGPNEVRIDGADNTLGLAELEIPEAAITLTPPEGQRGTELTVTGTGFIAREPVLLSYHSDAVVTDRTVQLAGSGLLANAEGGFELTFDVPITAEVGKEHLVTAAAEAGGETVSVSAEALHFVSQADITATPESVSPGDHLIITGQNLPLFTLVGPIRIAGIDVTPSTEVATDKNGTFEARVLVPHVEFGDQTLLVQVAGVVIPIIIEVAPPPLSGPPGQVFKEPIKAGALQAVWHYDNGTQAWSLFDPNLPEDVSDLNDLQQVTSGDIVWLNLSASLLFQGQVLAEGWNLIALK